MTSEIDRVESCLRSNELGRAGDLQICLERLHFNIWAWSLLGTGSMECFLSLLYYIGRAEYEGGYFSASSRDTALVFRNTRTGSKFSITRVTLYDIIEDIESEPYYKCTRYFAIYEDPEWVEYVFCADANNPEELDELVDSLLSCIAPLAPPDVDADYYPLDKIQKNLETVSRVKAIIASQLALVKNLFPELAEGLVRKLEEAEKRLEEAEKHAR